MATLATFTIYLDIEKQKRLSHEREALWRYMDCEDPLHTRRLELEYNKLKCENDKLYKHNIHWYKDF